MSGAKQYILERYDYYWRLRRVGNKHGTMRDLDRTQLVQWGKARGWTIIEPPEPASSCTWTEDSDGIWQTSCGEAHVFTTEGPEANRHRFCPYCGKGLEAAVQAGEPGDVSDLQELEDFEG